MYISGDYAKFKEKPKINRNPKKLPLLQHNLMNHGSSSHTHTQQHNPHPQSNTKIFVLIYPQFINRADRQIYIKAYTFQKANGKTSQIIINLSKKKKKS